jgi:hypothetical protein
MFICKRIFVSVFLLAVFSTQLFALKSENSQSQSQIGDKIQSAENAVDVSHLGAFTDQYKNNQIQLKNYLLNRAVKKEQLKSRLSQDFSAQQMVTTFIKELDRVSQHQKTRREFKKILNDLKRSNVESSSGGISGSVKIDGEAPTDEVIVLAFDDHGYYAGKNEASVEDGNYTITGLPNGTYYVVTWGQNNVDEIYNNVKAPLHSMEAWRDAELVTVTEAFTEGINFDLESGAQISGNIIDATSGQPFEDIDVIVSITSAETPMPIYSSSVYIENGSFSLPVPVLGNVKIAVTAAGYIPSFYENKTTWEDADIVTIASYDDNKTNINFALAQNPETAKLGGISGTVTPSGTIFPPLIFPAIVAAYNSTDTSYAAMGIQLSPIILPYKINNLLPGPYLLYGNDYLGDVIGSDNFLGAWASETVNVNEGEFVENINIKLSKGGSISGTVTTATGAAVDSLLILLINKNVSLTSEGPFLTQFELGLTVTKDDGSYKFTGLPEGEYVLRTFSDYTIQFDLDDIDNLIVPGKHAGLIVDEYWDGVLNVLQFADATPVLVNGTSETTDINFTLSPALYFVGNVTDAMTGLPTRDVSLIALNSVNAAPFWPFGKIDESGDYLLGPLPPGRYKILAVTGFGRDSGYLTEFYKNKNSFWEADSLDLVDQNVLNINFQLKKGATIAGYVSLDPADDTVTAGADTLEGFPVVAYYADGAQSGQVAGYDFVQFNGGYRINKLFPGAYKVKAIPTPSPFAANYFGGGNSFSDANSSAINVAMGEIADGKNIKLETASGTIQGTVTDASTGLPIYSVIVIAYNPSGHAAGFAVTGLDLWSGIPNENVGAYSISGLRPGNYFLRTFTASTLLGLLDQVDGLTVVLDNFDLENLGGLDFNLDLDFALYQDLWYPSAHDTIAVDLNNLLFQASAYGLPSEYDNAIFPVFIPAPFYQPVPGEALSVNVTSGPATTGIDFALATGGLEDNFDTNVEEEKSSGLVKDFNVFQNYPNPFNPETLIEYALPKEGRVTFEVYNVLGQKIATLLDAEKPAGQHIVKWNGTNDVGLKVSAGIYLVRMRAGNYQKSIKAMLLP